MRTEQDIFLNPQLWKLVYKIVCFNRDSISSWFSLERFYFSKNLSISSRLSILLADSCSQLSLMIFCISALSVLTSPFQLLILLIFELSPLFFFDKSDGLSILFIFSKNQLLVLMIFAIIFFITFSFISALIFMISFLLLTLGFLILLSLLQGDSNNSGLPKRENFFPLLK